MRSSELNSKVQFGRISFFILLTTISLLLFVSGYLGLALTLILMSLATLFFSTVLFTHYYLPEVPFNMVMNILGKTITQRVSSNELMINIVSGKINGDLTLPTKGKTNGILNIDLNSAAISLDQKTGYKQMHTGIHDLPRTASLCAVLPTFPQRFIFGPESSDSLSTPQSGEGLADFHVRINSAKKTATVAADGIVVYPKFECYYKIDNGHLNEGILALYKRDVEQNKISMPTLQVDFIQKFVYKLIMSQWEKVCSGKTSKQLVGEVPFRLFPDVFEKNGLSGVIFVSEIFLEE